MKPILLIVNLLLYVVAVAQDTAQVVEPQQTSPRNYDLLWIAIAGLILLIAFYFLFRKTRRIKN